ncbi:MAG: penicillin-binding protein 2 [Chloroflexi bacterium]|nr:penicillin-binding protein 2 [Chloroflexota bacterium]
MLLARLFYLQGVMADYYKVLASDEHWRVEQVPARRGTIAASDGAPLAVSVQFETLYAETKYIENSERTAAKLAQALEQPYEELLAKVATKQDMPTLVEERLPTEIADRVRALHLSHVYLVPTPKRYYPEGSFAAQAIGFVGRDLQGLAGLEYGMDAQLAGKPGVVLAERDTGGRAITLGGQISQPPEGGYDVILTIDHSIQQYVEQQLAEAVKKHQARGGTVIVMDVKTGAILAMANEPSLDLSHLDLSDPEQQKRFHNPAVSDLYEPGSVFKIVTMASGLDSGTVTPGTTLVDKGFFTYGGVTVWTWNRAPNGLETMTEVLVHSSNVGAAFVSTSVGAETFYRYVRAFGFGQATEIEIDGEAAGLIRAPGDPAWSPADLATNAFGQGIAATPLQVVTAIAAVANGGLLLRPHLVKELRRDNEIQQTPTTAVRRVISTQTARQLTDMMVAVVDGSALGMAKVPGYTVAGKTGTADIATTGGYNTAFTIASIGGFAPAQAPRIAVLVKIDAPQDIPWGEQVAGPVFSSVIRQALSTLGIPPDRPETNRP